MHLKKLELAGFKSFAERVLLELGPGLNAVVGPNGSGKSNIADALRWVLGEQSAKQLRGGKMEDIIFAGTVHRKPLGYAEITMRLDNSDLALPIEHKEIAVTRRVYRSGESEYSINGETCRLKDIQMLFMDTGVGRDGYSIIGQGRIDEILSLRSEDRRHVFEEAAGISKFKARRTEATNKLDREKQNRARVDDLILELQDQLTPLEEQSAEAQKYLKIRDEYKNIHINIFLEDIRKIEDDLKHTEESLANILSNSEDGKRQLLEARAAGEQLKNRAAEADSTYRRATEAVLNATTTIEQQQTELKLLESRAAQCKLDNERLTNEAEKRETQIAEKTTERDNETAFVQIIKTELEGLNTELSAQLALSDIHNTQLQEIASATDSFNQQIMDAMNAATESRAAVIDAENTYTRLENDKEDLNAETEQHEEKLEAQKEAVQNTEEALKHCTAQLSSKTTSQQAHLAAYTALKSQAEEAESSLRQATENLTATRGRFRALQDMENNREGYFRSVKSLLAKSSKGEITGICGAVGELIGVPREYETAIDIALGGAAQNIITQTENDAKNAINYLKSAKEGRATFLPLSAVKGKNIDTARLKNEQGFIGIAANLVSTDSLYKPVISQLLGDIVIIDSLDNALVIHKKFNFSYKIVTLGGERLSPGGAITGGSVASRGSGFIGRAQKLEALKAEVAEIQRVHEGFTKTTNSLAEKRAATREQLVKLNEQLSELQIAEKTAAAKLTTEKETLEKLHERSALFNEENTSIMQKIITANADVRAAKTALHEKETQLETARESLENYQREVEKNRLSLTEESDTITELRIDITRKTDSIEHAQKNIERLQKEIDTLMQEKRLILAEISANQAAEAATETEHATKTEGLEKFQQRLDDSRAELSRSEADKIALDTAISKAEADERTQTDATALLEREIARLEARKENLDATSHRLHNEIWEEYELTHQNALAFKREDLSETALRRTGAQLKSELSRMTNVNIGAIEAFKQITERHGFLTTQRDDILQAEAALDELIASLTTQMEAQFAEKFKIIAAHFEDVFKEMFHGGKASLRLLDQDHVLESGIEIIAQPPGKSLQNLMLLSGGERALTAIALLFAILRMKPSPFCVLDEIESALDDANVTRFANFLKQYAKGTQFIIITHRKGTMEAADNLYGVTMEEQGISKLVTVKFVD